MTQSKNTNVEEQRQFLQAELRVYYGPSQEKILYGFSYDMSSGGLFLITETELSADDMVMLSFTLPDIKKTINCKAKVAWVNLKDAPKKPGFPTGFGLQFIDLETEYFQAIQSLLKHGGVLTKS